MACSESGEPDCFCPITRDKITNGQLLMNFDLRSSPGRRFRHLVDCYSRELGPESSDAELSLVREAVALQLQAERMQEAIVRGESGFSAMRSTPRGKAGTVS
jgi:hypothetical protein